MPDAWSLDARQASCSRAGRIPTPLGPSHALHSRRARRCVGTATSLERMPGAHTSSALTTTPNGTPSASKWRAPQRTLSASLFRSFRKSRVLLVSRTRIQPARELALHFRLVHDVVVDRCGQRRLVFAGASNSSQASSTAEASGTSMSFHVGTISGPSSASESVRSEPRGGHVHAVDISAKLVEESFFIRHVTDGSVSVYRSQLTTKRTVNNSARST